MGKPSLKTAIIVTAGAGLLALFYVIFSALFSTEPGDMDRYARGGMSAFQTVPGAPPQPRTELATADGGQITLADKRGKVLLVNFWATWCAPCIVEMPELDALQARLGSDDFEVVAISMDRSMEEARRFYAEHGLANLALYHDPSFSAAMEAGARGLPLSVLYDRHGAEIGRLSGDAPWAGEDALALIEAAIARY